MSLRLQSPRPASLFDVSEGAYQFCIGIKPPWNASDSELPPSALIGRVAHRAMPEPVDQIGAAVPLRRLVGSGWYSPSLK